MPISLFIAAACFIAAVFLFGMLCGLCMEPQATPLLQPISENCPKVLDVEKRTIDIIA